MCHAWELNSPNANIDNSSNSDIGENTGGLVGLMLNGTVAHCEVNNGSIIVAGVQNTGMLVGKNSGAISHSRTNGILIGVDIAGGLTGWSDGEISNCSSSANISSSDGLGGLVGFNEGTIITSSASGDLVGSSGLGGLVGDNIGIIFNCHATGNVSGTFRLGGLIGYNGGPISECTATGSVSGEDDELGGLIGYNDNVDIFRCASFGDVDGTYFIGGLVGITLGGNGNIIECYSTGNVSGREDVGGLLGQNQDGQISNCYSRGSVAGRFEIGGLVGYATGPIINCFSTGEVTEIFAGGGIGGLVGTLSWFVDNSFWDTETSGQSISAGGTGKTTSEMQTESTFTSVGWDFTTPIWSICEGTNYPRLAWQLPAGDLLCPDGVNYVDYSFFEQQWMNVNCAATNDCNGVDLDLSGDVGIGDLILFIGDWMGGL